MQYQQCAACAVLSVISDRVREKIIKSVVLVCFHSILIELLDSDLNFCIYVARHRLKIKVTGKGRWGQIPKP